MILKNIVWSPLRERSNQTICPVVGLLVYALGQVSVTGIEENSMGEFEDLRHRFEFPVDVSLWIQAIATPHQQRRLPCTPRRP